MDMGVSKNRGTPKSSILMGFSIINHPFWGTTIFGNTHMFFHKWGPQMGGTQIPDLFLANLYTSFAVFCLA